MTKSLGPQSLLLEKRTRRRRPCTERAVSLPSGGSEAAPAQPPSRQQRASCDSTLQYGGDAPREATHLTFHVGPVNGNALLQAL